MADDEIALTEFTLECAVDVKFDASDVMQTCSPVQVLDLIAELDEQVGRKEFTLLAYDYFRRQAEVLLEEDPSLVTLTQEQLEDRLAAEEDL